MREEWKEKEVYYNTIKKGPQFPWLLKIYFRSLLKIKKNCRWKEITRGGITELSRPGFSKTLVLVQTRFLY